MITNPLLHLALFVGWTLFLLVAIEVIRALLMKMHGYSPSAFKAGERHGPEAYWRLSRAHANCLEFLPLYGSLILIMTHLDPPNASFFGWVSLSVIMLRPFQSLAHILSTTDQIIQIRATLFLSQVLALVCMLVMVLSTL